MGQSSIEWTDATWQVTAGCTRCSPGCYNCYAETMAGRLAAMAVADREAGRNPGKKTVYLQVVNQKPGTGRDGYGPKSGWNREVIPLYDNLAEPLGWKRPRRIFVNSESDLFHPDVPFDFIDSVFAVMALCPQHTFQVLTKRPGRMAEYLNTPERAERIYGDYYVQQRDGPGGWAYRRELKAGGIDPNYHESHPLARKNWWLGTSVEDQRAADERIPHLLRCPAAVRFLSCEPLLRPIQLDEVPGLCDGDGHDAPWMRRDSLHWVIVGGESGPGARPMDPDWARALRDQCQAAGVPLFHKQWGEWLPYEPDALPPFWNGQDGSVIDAHTFPDRLSDGDPVDGWWCPWPGAEDVVFRRIGKKAAGRLLDGRTWDELPTREVARA